MCSLSFCLHQLLKGEEGRGFQHATSFFPETVQFSRSVCPTLCNPVNHSTPGLPESITNSWSLPKLMSTESVMPSNHLILCHPFSSCPQSFPASGSFQMSQLFTSGGQNIGVSASTSLLLITPRADFL